MTTTASSSDRKRVIGYWVLTALFCLPIGVGGVFDALRPPEVLEIFSHLGYPAYFALLLGISKILGAAVVMLPGLPRLKEWAYAGITFDLVAAAWSHLAVGDPITNVIPPIVILGFGAGSYLLRPLSRRL
ncbi:DoxX family protein [Haliangium sp.]|uniref:DoxX family protein n=1 Tax=Haliangium sp. TaxID=2663208 RepID=UPI003D0AEC2A